jgi:hypothetical protein
MDAHIYTYTYTSIYPYISTYIHTYPDKHTHTYVYIYHIIECEHKLETFIWMYMHVYGNTFKCKYKNTYVYKRTYINIYITSSNANISSKHLSVIFSSVRLLAVPATSGTTINMYTYILIYV